jgi:tripartite-type tricarboxylate transporter receptor subunit TctC
MGFDRRRLLRALPAALALPVAARAQAFPARPVRIVVPFPPGGTTDLVSRLFAQALSRTWGQPVLVENKPGAGTVIGVDSVARAAPDGYSYVTVANSFTVNQTLVRRLPYDSQRDLRPVASIAYSEHLLAAHPSVPVKTAAELVAWARAHPGTLSYASFGNGTSAHLSGELLKLDNGIDLAHVPYKGQGPALQDLLSGQVQLMFGNLPEFLGHVRSGRLRALGLAMPRRSPFAPELPTLAEQGLPPIESTSWFGLLAPARTPDEVVARVNADVNHAMASAAMRDSFAASSLTALPGSPEDFARFLASETQRYAQVIRRAGIALEG